MSKMINLPSGATVTLRDPRELKQKDRAKLYIREEDSLTGGLAVINNLMAILIEEWSFDLIPPSVKIDSLGELSIADYDALQAEAEKAMPVLFPSLNAEANDDPKAPTAS